MEAIPIAAFWCIAVWTLFRQEQALVYLLFASMPFGSFAALPTGLTAGLTLTPTTVVALMLIARQLGSSRGVAKALDLAFKPSGLLFLSLFWVIAAVVTVFMPRFFAGVVEVVPVRFGASADTTMLAPTTQNLSQFVYVSISVLCVFAFSDMLRSASMQLHVLAALCLAASLTVLTGLLDFASQYLPLQAVLEPFRTASYALVTNDEILDSKRVIGLMPEASSFGGLALALLALLYFFRRVIPTGHFLNRAVPVLMALLAMLVWLSTSSAAYLGTAILGVVVLTEWCWRLVAAGGNTYLRRGLGAEFWFGALVSVVSVLVILATPHVLDPMIEMVDVMVLQKAGSSSFEERSMWTRVSFDALIDTFGLGVGLGGSRASNFAVALASNTGVLGAAFYFLFVLQTLLIRRAARGDCRGAALLSAVRWSYLAPFATSLTVGSTPDFGVLNAFLYGFAASLSTPRVLQARQPVVGSEIRNASRRQYSYWLTRQSGHGD